jgi:hypothetical protein
LRESFEKRAKNQKIRHRPRLWSDDSCSGVLAVAASGPQRWFAAVATSHPWRRVSVAATGPRRWVLASAMTSFGGDALHQWNLLVVDEHHGDEQSSRWGARAIKYFLWS